jgi:hypothetical protein
MLAQYIIVGEAADMETKPKSPTLVMVSPGIDSVMTHGLGFECLIEEVLSQNEQLWVVVDSRHW